MKSILECVPAGIVLRKVQEDFLLWYEKAYFENDVIACVLPVGSGKSICMITIAKWLQENSLGNCAICTPIIILQDQYEREFPHIPMLKGSSNYICRCDMKNSCEYSSTKQGSYCKPDMVHSVTSGNHDCCNYLEAKKIASASHTAIFNLHSVSMNQMWRTNMLIDEGHNASEHIIGRFGANIWECDANERKHPFPKVFEEGESFNKSKRVAAKDAIEYLTKWCCLIESEYNHQLLLPDKEQNSKLLQHLKEELSRNQQVVVGLKCDPDGILVLYKKGTYKNNSMDKRQFFGKEMPYLYIKPLKIDKLAKAVLWPEGMVKKILFSSATFGEQDIIKLGLSDKKYAIFEAKSPIPADRRPFRVWPVASMAYRNREDSLPKIALACMKIAEKHKDDKGVIHCTYDVANQIRSMAFKNNNANRFMFHTQRDKKLIYEQFLATKEAKILVASGMSEGIDLADDAARFQIMTMVIKPSIEDDVNYYQMKYDHEQYDWRTVLMVEQTSGRVCRKPTDKGVTYMIDSEFHSFFVKTHTNMVAKGKKSMWAEWFLDAVIWSDGINRR